MREEQRQRYRGTKGWVNGLGFRKYETEIEGQARLGRDHRTDKGSTSPPLTANNFMPSVMNAFGN